MKIQQHYYYKWIVVGMLWCVCLFNYADRQAIFSVFPLIKQEMHLSDVQLGVVGAAFMWIYAICGPVAGWVCDRVSRKVLVLGGLLFWSMLTAATALSHGYAQLVTCRALIGLGEALYFPAAMSLLGDYHGQDTRSRAMSMHQSSVYVGSIAGGGVSGFVGQYHGWRLSFVLFGVMGMALAALLWGVLREPVRGMSETNVAPHGANRDGGMVKAVGEVFANRMVVLLVLVFMGANFVAVVFLTWMPTFLYQKFHMSLSMAGLNGSAYLQAASVLGAICGGFAADAAVRRGSGWQRGGRMLTQAVGLLCGVPFLFLTGLTTTVPLLILGMVGFGYCKGIYDANIWASLYDVVPVERRGGGGGDDEFAWMAWGRGRADRDCDGCETLWDERVPQRDRVDLSDDWAVVAMGFVCGATWCMEAGNQLSEDASMTNPYPAFPAARRRCLR